MTMATMIAYRRPADIAAAMPTMAGVDAQVAAPCTLPVPTHVMITMPGHDHVLKAFGSTFAQSDGYKADHTSAVQRLAQAYGDAAVAQVLLVPDQQDLADHLVDGKMTADEWKGAAYPLIMPASMSGDVITMKGGFAPAEFDEAVYYDWR